MGVMSLDPYGDGYDAAWRRGRYKGYDKWSGPDCPFPDGTVEEAQWTLGFDDGADDHWEAWKNGET